MKIIIASNNKGKIQEMKTLFPEHEILSQKEANIALEVIEDQDTFQGNACKKATAIYQEAIQTLGEEIAVIADDSGLCIDALEGRPGVHTARYLGDASATKKNMALLTEMEGKTKRTCHFHCALVYYDKNGPILVEKIQDGQISYTMQGENGFGFDPIFQLEDGRTMAELTDTEKNNRSARYLATMALKEQVLKK